MDYIVKPLNKQDVVKAIEYAAAHGVSILNISLGSTAYNRLLHQVIESHPDILFVCAAGNNHNNGGGDVYPAAFSHSLRNIIAVAAADNTGSLTASTNRNGYVDIAAPGADIYTTIPGGYGFGDGTSMAAAFVSAAAAVVLGANSENDASYIKNALKYTAGLIDDVTGFGFINMAAALEYTGVIPDEEGANEYGLRPVPEAVLWLLQSGLCYSQLTAEQKKLLLDYLCLREDTMAEMEGFGFDILGSVYKVLIMQILCIDSDTMLEMVDAYGNEREAYRQTMEYDGYQRIYYTLNREMSDTLIGLLIQGYGAYNTAKAFIAASALNADVLDIIAWPGTESDGDFDEQIKQICVAYGIQAGFVLVYMDENDITADELMRKLESYEYCMFPITRTELYEDIYNIGQCPSAPFSYRNNAKESIVLNSGALTYYEHLVTIPGRNGLDLTLTAKYESKNANNFYWSGYDITYDYNKYTGYCVMTVDHKWNQVNLNNLTPMEYMGWGWSLNFSRIRINQHGSQLELANGASYLLRTVGNTGHYWYVFADHKINDMVFCDSYGNVPGSRFFLMHADGTKEYFNIIGNIVGIQDRYGNTIKFKYEDIQGTVTYPKKLTIMDTLDNVTLIEYNSSEYKITLPDNEIIKLILENPSYGVQYLKKVVDQQNKETVYGYQQSYGWCQLKYMPNAIPYEIYIYNPAPQAFIIKGGPHHLNHVELKSITYPTGGKTEYEYSSQTGLYTINPGYTEMLVGETSYHRITKRFDTDGSKVYNQETYTFSASNYTKGQPYTTIVTNADGVITYEFDKNHLKENETFKTGITTRRKISYEYNANKLPTKITTTIYGNGSNTHETIQQFDYAHCPKHRGD